ncbi:hypothetical protein VNO78_01444 [Psophocarpus tetragonolobus]|uniref:Uncharacterized protein n=1 Tax=Psophocarpus tetragonolobus TaxID=3891 RepID=A0AAN9XV68_PSOTE
MWHRVFCFQFNYVYQSWVCLCAVFLHFLFLDPSLVCLWSALFTFSLVAAFVYNHISPSTFNFLARSSKHNNF